MASASMEDSKMDLMDHTIQVIFLANDMSNTPNARFMNIIQNYTDNKDKVRPDHEEFKDQILMDKSWPLLEIIKMNYDEFLSKKKIEVGSSAAMRVVIMTEMSERRIINEVYQKSKKEKMCVMLVLPPKNDYWCAMVDPTTDGSDAMIQDDYELITDEMLQKIKQNVCSIKEDTLGFWVISTIYSMWGCFISPELKSLYNKHELMNVNWCFSGVPLSSCGFLDDRLGVTIYRNWEIQNCSVDEMTHAVFTGNNELVLIRNRQWSDDGYLSGALAECGDIFEIHDLSVTPLKYELINNNNAHCIVGDMSFDVIRDDEDYIPMKFEPNPALNTKEMEDILSECMEGVTMDLSLQCYMKAAVTAGLYSKWRGDIGGDQPGKIPLTFAWLKYMKYVVWCAVKYDASFLPGLLRKVRTKVNWKDINENWTDVLYPNLKDDLPNFPSLFRNCLFAAGIGEDNSGCDAMDFAVQEGDSKLIEAAYTYLKSEKAQSTLEEEMASKHARWSAQSKYFVQNYLMKEKGGKKALKVVSDSLIKFIRDRGDFGSVDLIGLVWHSDDQLQSNAVFDELMETLQKTLNYDTVHEDKTGFMWTKEAVLKHPLWLDKQKEDEDDEGEYDEEEKNEKEEKAGENSTLFELLKDHCDNEAGEKGGSDIQTEMTRLSNEEPEEWQMLTAFKPGIETTNQLRQDLVGREPDFSTKEIQDIGLRYNSLDFNAEKDCDSKAYLTKLLIDAHFVQRNFERLMKEALTPFGKLQIAPVKKASRVLPKSEEYATEKKKHCYWPYSACVIDLIRCSLTVNTIGEMVSALNSFESFLADHDAELSLIRCKNGFSKFKDNGKVPSKYCDVKLNVSCKDESGEKCVIGEVQFLLNCILQSKKKGHELYEVSRMSPLFEGAKKRLVSEWSVERQLQLCIDSDERLTRLLTFFPFNFADVSDLFYYLFKSKWTNQHLINGVANAIVDKCNTRDMSELTKDMFRDLDELEIIPVGTVSLMCAIIKKAGSHSDSVSLVRKFIDRYGGKKHLIRALVGLDESIKRDLIWDKRLLDGIGYYEMDDVTAKELTSVFQDWNKSSEVQSFWCVAMLLYWAVRHDISDDSSFVPSLLSLFKLNAAQFYTGVEIVYARDWEKRVPDYMIELIRTSAEELPDLKQGFLDREWITEDELHA